MDNFKVGDIVLVKSPLSNFLVKVVRVMKRFIELENKSRWDHYGHPYPRERFATTHMSLATSKDIEYFYRERLMNKINLDLLSTKKLKKLVILCNKKKKRKKDV